MYSLIKVLSQLPGIAVCCVCKVRIKLNDYWVTITPDDYNRLMSIKNLSHGYCPKCFTKTINSFKEELDEFKKPKDKW